MAGVGAGLLLSLHLLRSGKKEYKRKPGIGELSGGGIAGEDVSKVYADYYEAYGQKAGEGIKDRTRTTGELLGFEFHDIS